MNSTYRRSEPVGALIIDGEALLLLARVRVVRLSPIATVVFELAATGASFGSPADSDISDALQTILDDLAQAGVFTYGAGGSARPFCACDGAGGR